MSIRLLGADSFGYLAKEDFADQKKKQLYFILVIIYTSNKVKLKEGSERIGFAYLLFFWG